MEDSVLHRALEKCPSLERVWGRCPAPTSDSSHWCLWLPWAPAHTCVHVHTIKNSKNKSLFKGSCNFQFGCSPLSHLYWWRFSAPWFCNNEFFHFSGYSYLCASPSPPLPPPPCYISLKGLLSLRRTWTFLLSTILAFLYVHTHVW